MSDVGQQFAMKPLRNGDWRVYEITESPHFGPYAKVLRDDAGKIRNFHSEDRARQFIESVPDATEVEYPE